MLPVAANYGITKKNLWHPSRIRIRMMMNLPPYCMCSAEECEERLRCKEVSQFEKTNGTMDPTKMVTKYRRSAAGSKHRSPRNEDQLSKTISYLILLLIDSSKEEGLCLVDLVHFLEDRLRAVQVDYTILSVQSSISQHQIAKTHLILLYLLSDQSKQKGKLLYERRFGVTALQTALSCYWLEEEGTREDHSLRDTEILCFSILTQLNEFFIERKDEICGGRGNAPPLGSVWFQTVMLVRKHVASNEWDNADSLRWAMGLVAHISNGQWYCALAWLQKLDPGPFATLARCCVGSLVPILRWLVLLRLNRTLSKNQLIPMQDISRLLFFSDRTQCAAFVDDCGLPYRDDSVEFKVVEMQLPRRSFSRRSDAFVFGGKCSNPTITKDGITIPRPEVLRELLVSD